MSDAPALLAWLASAVHPLRVVQVGAGARELLAPPPDDIRAGAVGLLHLHACSSAETAAALAEWALHLSPRAVIAATGSGDGLPGLAATAIGDVVLAAAGDDPPVDVAALLQGARPELQELVVAKGKALLLEVDLERERLRCRQLERDLERARIDVDVQQRSAAAHAELLALVQGSLSWRLTAPLRSANRLSAPLRDRVRIGRRIAAEPDDGGARSLFAGEWYLDRYPDAALARDPLSHYLDGGASNGRSPSPLFDAPWYLETYAAELEGRDPLVDFASSGVAARRDPNRYLSTAVWLDAAERGEVDRDLVGYLGTVGRSLTDRRVRAPSASVATAVHEGEQTLCAGVDVCVYAHYDPNGLVDPYVVLALEALADARLTTLFLSSCTTLQRGEIDKVRPFVARAVTTTNQGRDWGLFHAGLGLAREAGLPASAILLNDSVYAHLAPLGPFLERAAATGADIVGATDSFDRQYHLQSYFLKLGPAAFAPNGLVDEFLASYVPVAQKPYVIHAYELGFARRATAFRLSLGAVWPYRALEEEALAFAPGEERRELVARRLALNPSHSFWDLLLRHGCPFLKVELLRDNPTGVGNLDVLPSLVPSTALDPIEAHLARLSDQTCERNAAVRE